MKIKRKVMAVCDALDRYNNEGKRTDVIEFELTDEEVFKIYEAHKLKLLYEDAKYYIEQFDDREGTDLASKVTDEDLGELVDQFQEKTYYREDPFMGVWDDIITEYAEDYA